MESRPLTATRLALALLSASRAPSLSANALVGAAELLGSSSNSMRVALSRLVASGDVELAARGRYALAESARAPAEHVRRFRTGFARRVDWSGGFVAVFTADLPRRNPTLVRRRERALGLVGLRAYRHGIYVRPDNLEGGRDQVRRYLDELGLDGDADVVSCRFDDAQRRAIESSYAIDVDASRAEELDRRVRALLARLDRTPTHRDAKESFFVGDEVLRFLARDPLLPPQIADPSPRRSLAESMATLDERGHAIWQAVIDEFEGAKQAS